MTRHVILFLAANPQTTDPLRLGEECNAIERELKLTPYRGDFQLESRWAVGIDDLVRHLNDLAPTVVHFSGHGAGENGLLLQDDQGQPQMVSARALAMIMKAAASDARLVVLNACYTTVQAETLRTTVDCVVGMAGAIGDDAARAFASRFYGALGNRRSIGNAVDQAVAALAAKQLPDEMLPRCVTRDGVDGYRVFLQPRDDTAPAPAYPNSETRALSEQLENARLRKKRLHDAGLALDEVDQEILTLRRRLRDGGHLRAGDALHDGRYLLIQTVGSGGFAVVWEAFDRNARRQVAIKVLHQHFAGDQQRRDRFFRGARVMMSLTHPAVVRVYDTRGEDDGFCYYVMEFVPGGTLRDLVLAKRTESSQLLLLILQVGEALAEAHGRQLVHRDIKPLNILLDENANARLTDFDLVRAHDTTGGTHTGALGTLVYAAPECLDRPQEATPRADVFSLGMTAIFCLFGQDLPMSTFRNPRATLEQIDCPKSIQEVLAQAIALTPEGRFADALAMIDALRRALSTAGQSVAIVDRGDERTSSAITDYAPRFETSRPAQEQHIAVAVAVVPLVAKVHALPVNSAASLVHEPIFTTPDQAPTPQARPPTKTMSQMANRAAGLSSAPRRRSMFGTRAVKVISGATLFGLAVVAFLVARRAYTPSDPIGQRTDPVRVVSPTFDASSAVQLKPEASEFGSPISDARSEAQPKSDVSKSEAPIPDARRVAQFSSDGSKSDTPIPDAHGTAQSKSDVPKSDTPVSDAHGEVSPKLNVSEFEALTGTYIDSRDGKRYKWVRIGSQIWFAENLAYRSKTGFYPASVGESGSAYSLELDGMTPAEYLRVFGGLYSWEAARTSCPSGWHLPTKQEWENLIAVHGGAAVAGRKMSGKAGDYSNWGDWNQLATNNFSFGVLPGGRLEIPERNLAYARGFATLWSATEVSAISAIAVTIQHFTDGAYLRPKGKAYYALNVRCIKN